MNKLKISLLILFSLSINLLAKEFSVCKEYSYIKENQAKQKETFLEKILKQDPSNVECMVKLASVYLRSDRVADGFDLVRRAYALDSSFVKKHKISKVLDLALRLSRLKEIAIKKGDKDLWNELGDNYYELNIFKEAKKAYENSLKIDESQTRIAILSALCDANLNSADIASRRLIEIVKKEPYNFYANYYLGKILKNSLNKRDKAKWYLSMAEYLIKYRDLEFENESEKIFLQKDIEHELKEE